MTGARLRAEFILFGDSITQQSFMPNGWGASLTDVYQRTADIKLRGYSGYNTRWALRLLDEVFPSDQEHPPELVTVLLGANDAALPPPLKSQLPEASRQHVPLDEYEDNLRSIVHHLQRGSLRSTRVLLVSPPPCDTDAWSSHCITSHNLPADAEPNRNHENTARYAAAAVSLGKQMNIPTVDLHSIMTADSAWRSKLSDGLHPNALGQTVIADAILSAIGEHYPELKPGSFFEDNESMLPLDFPDHKAVDTESIDESITSHRQNTRARMQQLL